MTTSEREQSLDTTMHRSQAARLSGRIDQRVRDAERHAEAETSQERWHEAINDEWEILYGVATSGAHGWQIVTDDEGRQILDEHAYPEDLSTIVFENGWIHLRGVEWMHDESVAEFIRETKRRRLEEYTRMEEKEMDAFEDDDRIVYDEDVTGEPMKDWWRFEPTGYVGRPDAVVAHAEGYDAVRED